MCLRRVSAPEKINRKDDDRSQKQQVNQIGGDKATVKPDQP
jgi:hypothetical protein